MLASKRHHPGSWRRPAGRTVVSSRYKFIQTTTVDSTGLQDAHNPWPGGLQPDTAALCSVSCKQHPALQKSCSEVGHTAPWNTSAGRISSLRIPGLRDPTILPSSSSTFRRRQAPWRASAYPVCQADQQSVTSNIHDAFFGYSVFNPVIIGVIYIIGYYLKL